MPPIVTEQNALRIGVDVGGTFTDLVWFDLASGKLGALKLPSTPPDFHLAAVEAVGRVRPVARSAHVIHGSTVATNALLQRALEPCAFVTTEGFRDMLLIGRQNRPNLYALRVTRPKPLALDDNGFTVRERIGANGQVIEPLMESGVDRLIEQIRARGLRHVAVCLLFSFINPIHERLIGRHCEAAGLSVSLSSDVLPEFREYERASTTVINASLRPTVRRYLELLNLGLGKGEASQAREISLAIMHSGGGTLSVEEAQRSAARLVLSGPAGGVIGAAFVASAAGFRDVITYDMGGTSTDVATIFDGQPQWTTSSAVDGLPIGLPALDIHTVGAGGGSIAWLDAGGALRIGPRSAGAVPGPACYARGGVEPTVTDANLLLGRILPNNFAGGVMRIDVDLARQAIEPLALAMGKSIVDAALGILRVAEHNMGRAIRAVTSHRGLDPRNFTLLSFGGAGGLHACALAEALEIPRVYVPPLCGVLSALGMIVAPPVADASRTVVHLAAQLDDARLAAEFGMLSGQTMDRIGYEQTASVEAWADVRFRGQSHELTVRVDRPAIEHIVERFRAAYHERYGWRPAERPIDIVTLRVRRLGRVPAARLPTIHGTSSQKPQIITDVVLEGGNIARTPIYSRPELFSAGARSGPLLLVDPEATTLVPPGWRVEVHEDGGAVLERNL